MRSRHSVRRIVRPVSIPSAFIAGFVLVAPPVTAQEAGEGGVASRVVAFKLPANGVRIEKEEQTAQFSRMLDKMAALGQAKVGRREFLIWPQGSDPRARLAAAMRAGGYQYALQKPILENDQGSVVPFTAGRTDGKPAVIGIWVASPQATMLAWGTLTDGAATEERAPEPATGKDGWAPAAASQIARVALPAKAMRSTDADFNAGMAGNLRKLVAQGGYDVTPVEVLLWEGEAAADPAANRKVITDALKKAGYQLQTQPAQKGPQGTMTLFLAVHGETRQGVIGSWIEGPVQMLVWGRLEKKAAAE
jgi:hypothetical protein